jgi:hypothetical protein
MNRYRKCHYDVRLLGVDDSCKRVSLQLGRERIVADSDHSVLWPVGTVGRLRLLDGARRCVFMPYIDQRLRRLPELDETKPLRWAWRLGDRVIRAKPHVTPGVDGAVAHDATVLVGLPIPPEFVDLCRSNKLAPHAVLRAFIADLCESYNTPACPREDGFCTNGPDERMRANDYFYRTFGWRCSNWAAQPAGESS